MIIQDKIDTDYAKEKQKWLQETDEPEEIFVFLLDLQDSVKHLYENKNNPQWIDSEVSINFKLKILAMLENYAQHRFDLLNNLTAQIQHRFQSLCKIYIDRSVYRLIYNASKTTMTAAKKALDIELEKQK